MTKRAHTFARPSFSDEITQLQNHIESHQLEEPEYVDIRLKTLRREILSRNAERLEARRREIESRLDALKTTSEKKRELEAEKARIEKQLQTA